MANMYDEMVRLTAPDQLSLLNLFQPGVRQYLGGSPSLLNFQPPQRVPAAVPYVPMADVAEEVTKEPETLTVDTGGPEMGQAMHPAVLAFLDNEAKTPGARDARIGNINAMLTMANPFAASGLFGAKGPVMGLLGALLNATNPGQAPAPVTSLTPSSYGPNAWGGYVAGTDVDAAVANAGAGMSSTGDVGATTTDDGVAIGWGGGYGTI